MNTVKHNKEKPGSKGFLLDVRDDRRQVYEDEEVPMTP